MRVLLALFGVAVLAVGLPAYAAHCGSDYRSLCPDHPPCSIYEVTGGSADSTYYLHHREGIGPNSFWLYEETNGIWVPKPAGAYADSASVAHDLQRGGCSALFPSYCERWVVDCPLLPPDQLIY